MDIVVIKILYTGNLIGLKFNVSLLRNSKIFVNIKILKFLFKNSKYEYYLKIKNFSNMKLILPIIKKSQ